VTGENTQGATAVDGVSVIIPHYGDPRMAQNLLESLHHQVGNPPVQMIVVDDCSPTPFPDTPGITLIQRSVNGGFGSAVNSGAAAAVHNHLLVLNSDLSIEESFIAQLVAQARILPPSVISRAIFDDAENYQWPGRKFPRTRYYFAAWLTPLARYRNTRWWHRSVGHDVRCAPGLVTKTDWVIGAAMLIPTAPFRALGGFDESFFMNSEEVDLQQRLTGLGVGSVVAGTVVAHHTGGGSSDSLKRRQWLVQSWFRYAKKKGASVSALRFFLRLASAINFVFNAVRQLFGRGIDARSTLSTELSLTRLTS
jgi:N-acetylglucosaminyl-diphospho-decaprenol L-rhamnosyltransferase